VTAVELVGVLVGTSIATLHLDVDAEAEAGAGRLNALLDAEPSVALSRGATIAVPALGLGLPLNAMQVSLYRTLKAREDPDPTLLASGFIQRCHEAGGHPVIEGRVIADQAEAHGIVTQTYEEMIERAAPIWRTIGMI
jgi:hypothetical protein